MTVDTSIEVEKVAVVVVVVVKPMKLTDFVGVVGFVAEADGITSAINPTRNSETAG